MKTSSMLGTALLLLGAAAACSPESPAAKDAPMADAGGAPAAASTEETRVEEPAPANDEAHPAALPEVRYYLLSDA